MSISLEKKVEQVGIVLAKRGMPKAPIMKVGAAFDVSGSARGMYRGYGNQPSIMQQTFDRLLAMSLKFDDNGELDVWTFESDFNQLRTATEKDEGTYIETQIEQASKDVNGNTLHKWGGTEYAGVLKSIIDFYYPASVAQVAAQTVSKIGGFIGGLFGKKEQPAQVATTTPDVDYPSMLYFLTDGDNSDHSDTLKLLEQIKQDSRPIYIQMVGVGGGSSFPKLQQYAAKYDNVGFVNLNSLDISDTQLFEAVITQELVDWSKTYVK